MMTIYGSYNLNLLKSSILAIQIFQKCMWEPLNHMHIPLGTMFEQTQVCMMEFFYQQGKPYPIMCNS